MSWAQAQTTATVWLEKNEEQYCSPPYVPADHFNCVLIMGQARSKCLTQVERYITQSAPRLLLVVDEVPYTPQAGGSHYLGGPVWRGA